jgi:hypothetical protein
MPLGIRTHKLSLSLALSRSLSLSLSLSLTHTHTQGSLLHPCQSDARERARRWGEIVVMSGGLDAPLKLATQV